MKISGKKPFCIYLFVAHKLKERDLCRQQEPLDQYEKQMQGVCKLWQERKESKKYYGINRA